jgi:predicted enzyme related to lactoylglutathione lyase
LRFYRDRLGHPLLWRHDQVGQAGLRLADGGAELVLTTRGAYSPSWLVQSVDEAAASMVGAGGRLTSRPKNIPVGRLAVVADPFGNELVVLDLSIRRYVTGEAGHVTGVR